jgi:ribonuclease HI
MGQKKPKFYVVWAGRKPGVYASWAEASEQVTGVAGARFKSFESAAAAREAFEKGQFSDHAGLRAGGTKSLAELADLGVVLDAIAVDAACAGVPGPVQYRGVHVQTGAEIFHQGPFPDATNNIGEFLGIVHALAFLHERGKHDMPVYSDSCIALSWVRNQTCRTKHPQTPQNAKVFELIARAERWLRSHPYRNPVLKWQTRQWGEIPADYGRK